MRNSDRGASAVEFAFIIPVVLYVVFGLIDIGLYAYASTQAHAAARDGARVAQLQHYTIAPDGADFTDIKAATLARLDSGVQASAKVTVACNVNPCSRAVDGQDKIIVSVSWSRSWLTYFGPLISKVGFDPSVSGESMRTVIGVPR